MIKSWRSYSSNLPWNEPEWTQVIPAEPKQAQVNPSSNYNETTTHFLLRIKSVHLQAKQSQVNPSEAKRRQAELSMYMCTLCNCLLCRTFVAQLFWSRAATLFVRQCLSVSKRWSCLRRREVLHKKQKSSRAVLHSLPHWKCLWLHRLHKPFVAQSSVLCLTWQLRALALAFGKWRFSIPQLAHENTYGTKRSALLIVFSVCWYQPQILRNMC